MAKYSKSAAHLKVDDNLSDDWEYLGDKMVAAGLTVVLVFPWEAATILSLGRQRPIGEDSWRQR